MILIMDKIPQINSHLISSSKQQLKILPFSKTAVKLKAICALEKNSISKVAQVFNCSRNTLKNWVKRFSEDGVGGIVDKPRKPRKSKLTDKQKSELSELLQDHHSNWTLLKLQKLLNDKYEIQISKTGLWKIIKDLDFSYITPRKQHYLQDKAKLAEFKKNST
jgi:transposase